MRPHPPAPVAWHLDYPAHLPITARREEIVRLLRAHPVVVLAGETGSGKTTQLPKLCLEAGFDRLGRLACTQPRRVAAVSISKRVAEELQVGWGREVGCRIRFEDRTTPQTRIKFLTDGMLLAEAQADPFLRDYGCIIVDEAHERSLNIDFLLGHLRQLRRRRPGLKLVITSATIDTAAFSAAFDGAPVVEVSGRVFPVETIYAPVDELLAEHGDFTVVEAAAQAVERILLESDRGDILVFLPTEKDIRETCDLLAGRRLGPLDLLPLYGRQAGPEQQRVFASSPRRKIVVSTNIAETSLTIPGIRFVVDSGEARLSRFNPRTRTRRLPIEPISQSSADQRRGRCGRVENGVCIRLYSEKDYLERPRFTPPEILRCNLAEVILRLESSGLGEIETFPFLEPPPPAAIRAGRQLLEELGALGGDGRLTDLGRELARLPADPTIGRMILQAAREHALREVLVIAAALSVQDPRERPEGEEAKAEAEHRKFVHPESDFLTLLAIWDAYHDEFERLSLGKLRRFCTSHYLSFLRMREWMETHAQLEQVLADAGGYRLDQRAPESGPESRRFGGSFYRAIHRSLLPGLLANAARREEGQVYRAGADRKVHLFPGSGLFVRAPDKRSAPPAAERPRTGKRAAAPDWIVAGEVVETTRLYARTCARIDPDWLLELGAHVIKVHHSDPIYEPEQARVLVRETARLHGLEIATRHIDYGRVDPARATEIFIREALLGEGFETTHAFLAHNRRLRDKVELMRTQVRGGSWLDLDDAQFRFYASRLEGVSSRHDLNRVIKSRHAREPKFLHMDESDLIGGAADAVDPADFPDEVAIGTSVLPVDYAYRPGTETDGVTLRVPVRDLAGVGPAVLDWLVPAQRLERIELHLRALDKDRRVRLHPLAERAREIAARLEPGGQSMAEALATWLRLHFGFDFGPEAFARVALPDHLAVRIEVHDDNGRVVASGRDLAAVRARVLEYERELARGAAPDTQPAWREAVRRWERPPQLEWPIDTLPAEMVVADIAGVPLRAWPGLHREEGGVAVRLFRRAVDAEDAWPAALESLFAHALRHEIAYASEDLREWRVLGPRLAGWRPLPALQDDAREAVRALACVRPWLERSAAAFRAEVARRREVLRGLAFRLRDELEAILAERVRVLAGPARSEDVLADVARLVPPDLLRVTPVERLGSVTRYLKAAAARAAKAALDPERDAQRAAEVQRYASALDSARRFVAPAGTAEERVAARVRAGRVEALRWLVEEYRVSVFAQELGTAVPVSPKRLDAALAELGLTAGAVATRPSGAATRRPAAAPTPAAIEASVAAQSLAAALGGRVKSRG